MSRRVNRHGFLMLDQLPHRDLGGWGRPRYEPGTDWGLFKYWLSQSRPIDRACVRLTLARPFGGSYSRPPGWRPLAWPRLRLISRVFGWEAPALSSGLGLSRPGRRNGRGRRSPAVGVYDGRSAQANARRDARSGVHSPSFAERAIPIRLTDSASCCGRTIPWITRSVILAKVPAAGSRFMLAAARRPRFGRLRHRDRNAEGESSASCLEPQHYPSPRFLPRAAGVWQAGLSSPASGARRERKVGRWARASTKARAAKSRTPPRRWRFCLPARPKPSTRARASSRYGDVPGEADVVVALGGDGLMLRTLHKFMGRKPIYGMNRGSVGFLMNEIARPACASGWTPPKLDHPSVAHGGREPRRRRISAHAINEVSLLRQSAQSAKLRVHIDGQPAGGTGRGRRARRHARRIDRL